MRTCTKCGETKPLARFYPTKRTGRRAFTAQCRTCMNAYSVAYGKANKERINERNRRPVRPHGESDTGAYLMEEWRPIPGHEGRFSISSIGRVRSERRTVLRRNGTPMTVQQRILKLDGSRTYLTVGLWIDGRNKTHFVHCLVALAFLGPRPEGLDTMHLNGDARDNRFENLKYGTRSENIRDSVKHGTQVSIAKTHCPQGHPYDDENTLVYASSKNGRPTRTCKICKRERGLASYYRMRDRRAVQRTK